jgi:hypothetical protein
MAMGAGGRGAVLEGTAMVGCVDVLAWTTGSCCLRDPKNAAVVAAPTTAEAPATAARVSLLMAAAGIIGGTVRQRLEEAAGSAWSIYLSVVCLHQHADVIICSAETGMNFAQPIIEHRGRSWSSNRYIPFPCMVFVFGCSLNYLGTGLMIPMARFFIIKKLLEISRNFKGSIELHSFTHSIHNAISALEVLYMAFDLAST